MLEVVPLDLDGVVEIRPERIGDARGFFSESWSKAGWEAAGLPPTEFVQDNHSRSARGVLRGLHYQLPPFQQAKLVRVSRGSVFDVVVDIRAGSPSFGQWLGRVLSEAEWNQLFVPAGFAHGFLALEPETEVQYKVSAPYSAAHDRTIRAEDPALGIAWPLPAAELIQSAKDLAAPMLADAELL